MQKDARERYQNLFDEEKCKNRKQTNKQTKHVKDVKILLKKKKTSILS